MLRLLGILSSGNLLFGGRHTRRALRRGLLLGALLGYFANRDFDMNRVQEDVRETARKARKTAREAARAIRKEIHNARKAEHDQRIAERLEAIHAEAEARRAEREARKAAREEQKTETGSREVYALPECDTREAKEIRDLAEDLERDARTAAMAADVPVIQFPDEDEKYHASRKYGYV